MRQFSATALWRPSLASVCLLALGLFLPGCRKQEISSYSVPKESAPPAPSIKAPMPGLDPAALTPHAPGQLSWATPQGWQEQPAGGMRVGSFTVAKGGQTADVSIIPLGGRAGSELENVNRWRNQVGLEPTSADKLAASGEKVSIGSAPAQLHDLLGTDPQTKQPTRILAASLSAEGTTWFFKMIGPDGLVAQEKPTFIEFLKSVQFQTGQPPGQSAAGPTPTLEPPTGMKVSPQDMAAFHGGEAADKPKFEVPAGWQEQAPSSMRLATFKVTGEKGEQADVSVVKLAGEGGGLLLNVNRWRGQVGLTPVDQAGLEKLVTTENVGGAKITVVDMSGRSVESGEQARILAAVVPRSGTTWFYKMIGNDQLVAQQKTAFIKFVETARYPNAS